MTTEALITGGYGFLGRHLQRFLSAYGWNITAPMSRPFNICDPNKWAQFQDRYDVIVHCAAATDVDACQAHPKVALEVNRDGTMNMVALCAPHTKFVYISTDMVYGDDGPHREYDFDPVNVYGETKLAGEIMAAARENSLVLRTNFFGPSHDGSSFSDYVIRELSGSGTPLFFNDILFSPLHVLTLCSFVYSMVEADLRGVYNLGSYGGMSKAQFAQQVAAHLGLDFSKAAVGPSHFKVKRPRDMRLDCTLLERLGYKMPTLEEEIKKL